MGLIPWRKGLPWGKFGVEKFLSGGAGTCGVLTGLLAIGATGSAVMGAGATAGGGGGGGRGLGKGDAGRSFINTGGGGGAGCSGWSRFTTRVLGSIRGSGWGAKPCISRASSKACKITTSRALRRFPDPGGCATKVFMGCIIRKTGKPSGIGGDTPQGIWIKTCTTG